MWIAPRNLIIIVLMFLIGMIGLTTFKHQPKTINYKDDLDKVRDSLDDLIGRYNIIESKLNKLQRKDSIIIKEKFKIIEKYVPRYEKVYDTPDSAQFDLFKMLLSENERHPLEKN